MSYIILCDSKGITVKTEDGIETNVRYLPTEDEIMSITNAISDAFNIHRYDDAISKMVNALFRLPYLSDRDRVNHVDDLVRAFRHAEAAARTERAKQAKEDDG